MPPTRLLLSRDWLLKACHDLASARKLAGGDDPYLDTAIYHCQQVAEKAIKGFLFYSDIVFEKTHDVRLLVQQASKADGAFAELMREAGMLTPYAAEYRYPNEVNLPSQDEFKSALDAAERIYHFVLSKRPELDPEAT